VVINNNPIPYYISQFIILNNGNVVGVEIYGVPINDPQWRPSCFSISNRFIVMGKEILGRPSSSVRFGIDTKSGLYVAIKIANTLLKIDLQRMVREVEILTRLTSLGHPNITKMIYWEKTSTHITIITEYETGGELGKFISKNNPLSTDLVKSIFKQIVSSVRLCHSLQIIHRDIKHQNIMLDGNNNPKLIDFNLAMDTGKEQMKSWVGTAAFCSPEILSHQPYKGGSVDIWSLGVVLYSMLTNQLPFKTLADVLNGTLPQDVPWKDQDCLDLLKKMFELKPENRIDIFGVFDHPWLTPIHSSISPPSPKKQKTMKLEHSFSSIVLRKKNTRIKKSLSFNL